MVRSASSNSGVREACGVWLTKRARLVDPRFSNRPAVVQVRLNTDDKKFNSNLTDSALWWEFCTFLPWSISHHKTLLAILTHRVRWIHLSLLHNQRVSYTIIRIPEIPMPSSNPFQGCRVSFAARFGLIISKTQYLSCTTLPFGIHKDSEDGMEKIPSAKATSYFSNQISALKGPLELG